MAHNGTPDNGNRAAALRRMAESDPQLAVRLIAQTLQAQLVYVGEDGRQGHRRRDNRDPVACAAKRWRGDLIEGNNDHGE